jgi:hypothetical protein
MRKEQFRRIRKLVEDEIVFILTEQYCQLVDPGLPIRYYLDFKTDERLIELREVLDRMDRGTFGCCSLCGIHIPARILEASPIMKLCSGCDGSSFLNRHRRAHVRRALEVASEQAADVKVGAANLRTRAASLREKG